MFVRFAGNSCVVASLILVVGCGADAVARPLAGLPSISDRASAIVAKAKPGSMTRIVPMVPGRLSESHIRRHLEMAGASPSVWHAFAVRDLRSSLSLVGRSSGKLDPSFNTIEAAGADTLIGGLDSQIGGTVAEFDGSARATQNRGATASVEAIALPMTFVGSTETDQTAEMCAGPSPTPTCSFGAVYAVNCNASGGSRIHVDATYNVAYSDGINATGDGDTDKSCFPSGGGGGGSGGAGDGGGGRCEQYIVEESDDGGNTWYEIGEFTTCMT